MNLMNRNKNIVKRYKIRAKFPQPGNGLETRVRDGVTEV